MVTKNDLAELYSPSLFSNTTDSFSLRESQKDASVKGAEFILPGAKFIVCSEGIWSSATDLYTKKSAEFEFKKVCDGFVLCDFKGDHYMLWIELKSGFSEVFNKAIYQLSGCYVKAKSYLRNIAAYNPDDYKELGIVVSLPEEQLVRTTSGNASVFNRRNQLIQEETASELCRRRYRKTGSILMKGDDFGSSRLHLSDEIMLKELPVASYTTIEECPTIDLEKILNAIYP